MAEFLITHARLFEEKIDVMSHRLMARTNTGLDRGRDTLRNLTERLERQSIQYLAKSSVLLRKSIYLLQTQTLSLLRTPSINIKAYEERLKGSLNVVISNNSRKLGDYVHSVTIHPRHMLSIESKTLEHLEIKAGLLDPVNVLKRGYSITYLHGKAVRGTASVRKDDIINTRLYDGSITSRVESIKEKTENEEQ